MDLTPRPQAEVTAPRRRRWVPVLVLVLVIGAGGVIVANFLTSAIDYYCNADEVGVREGCEADRRIRIQGTVDEGSLQSAAGSTSFSLSFNDATINVVYEGDPGGIFQECIPVVAHGRLVGETFQANRIEVRHSNEYMADNADRVNEAEAQACSQQTG